MNVNRKTIAALLAGLCLLTSVSMAACGSDCDNCIDANNDGYCDNCGHDVAPETVLTTAEETTETVTTAAEVAVSLTVKNQKGTAIAGAVLTVTAKSDDPYETPEPVNVTTDADGAATLTLTVGEYYVEFDNLPEYHVSGRATLTVAEGMEAVLLEVTDNTPDGTEAHPFFLNTESTTVAFLADTTYCFTMFAGDRRSIVIENASDLELTLEGKAYAPDENGVIRVPLVVDQQQSHLALTIKSKVAQDVVIGIVAEPGSSDNPISVEAGVDIVCEVPKDTVMYYTFTGTVIGSLTLTCTDPLNNISMTNKTTSQATNFTGGSTEPVELSIHEGDVIVIAVSIIGGDQTQASHTLTFQIMQNVQ